jgi:hypothetical protein
LSHRPTLVERLHKGIIPRSRDFWKPSWKLAPSDRNTQLVEEETQNNPNAYEKMPLIV